MRSRRTFAALLTVLSASAVSCRSTVDLPSAPQPRVAQTPLRVPELDALLREVHAELLRLARRHAWLATYDDDCYREGRSIFYMPVPKRNKTELLPQQPDQLAINYLGIAAEKGFKYSNDVESFEECRFPSLGAKIYAHVLVRGQENAPVKAEIIRLVVDRCGDLHARLANGGG